MLAVKLRRLERWNELRAAHAARYAERLSTDTVTLPAIDPRAAHVWHLYVVRPRRRDALARGLAARGVETAVHYPVPIHLQPAYRDLGLPRGSFPIAERAAGEVLSLPMYPELTESQVERVCDAIRAVLRELDEPAACGATPTGSSADRS